VTGVYEWVSFSLTGTMGPAAVIHPQAIREAEFAQGEKRVY
jgi:hypothetical protein